MSAKRRRKEEHADTQSLSASRDWSRRTEGGEEEEEGRCLRRVHVSDCPGSSTSMLRRREGRGRKEREKEREREF